LIPAKRQEAILAYVNEKGIAVMPELTALTGASRSSVRRDIEEMHSAGLLVRTHGGAKRVEREQSDDIPLNVRQHTRAKEKREVAHAALELIQPGDTLFLNAGTTTLALASLLSAFSNLTVITYDLLIALEVARTSNRLIVAGGELRRGSVTLADTFTLSMMEQFFVQKAFISADSVDIDHGYMDYNPYEIAIKRRMIENASQPVMLLDSSKFEARAFANICPLSDVSHIITDSELPSETAERFAQKGVAITLARQS
jgi:DeoR/GlpR family transcriptional regulator of sugar metabolism